ncbi:hypothetical protein VTH06DRAFT_7582 [Thermothelomyces fergusii]
MKGFPSFGAKDRSALSRANMRAFATLLVVLFHLCLGVPVGIQTATPNNSSGNKSVHSLAWFERYHDYAAHLKYIHGLSQKHRSLSQTFLAGNSFEKRPIQCIHAYGRSGPGLHPAIVFLGTVHAREWITTMVTEYIAFSLLEHYRHDSDVRHALDSFDFYIFPIVNPDGFIYSQTQDRMWRKNRQRQRGTTCVGRDLNRNWDVQWGMKGGAATAPCRSTYRGSKPLDAPETRALAVELRAIKESQGVRLFIDWHAFGQLVMYPYGYSCEKKLPPFSAVRWLAGELAEAMGKVHGSRYRAGTACELLYPTSGDSADWAFDVLGADYAYTVELRPGLRARAGFRLPESEILETAEEAWAGVRHVLKFIRHPR